MSQEKTGILIQNCDVLTLQEGEARVVQQQDIDVRGKYIHAITPHTTPAGEVNAQEHTQVIDGSGMLAIPGLMNTHAHVAMVLFRGLAEDVSVQKWFNDYIFPVESNLTPEDVYWGALLGVAEMIEGGGTCVADHYFFMDEVAQAVQEAGTRANLAWAVFGHEGETKLDQTCEFVQRWQGGADERITTWLGPHAPYTTGSDFLRLCASRAKALGVGIHVHVSETAEQVALSKREHGITPLQMLAESGVLEVPVILAHCLYPEEVDFPVLQAARAGIAHAPKTYLKLGMGTAPVRRYRQLGIPLGLASDGAVSSNTLDILEQLRLLALTQKQEAGDSTVMTVYEALDIAFNGSAGVLQREADLGAISPGRLADITLLRQDGLHSFPRLNPAANLVYSTRASDVDTVICDGRLLMQQRRLLTIDKERVKREVASRLERLGRRLPGVRIAVYPA